MSEQRNSPRAILHVDMDAFYASVEERDNPRLVGKPVIVGGTPESRGVVAAANYAARKFGVHSAMSAAQARRLCPQAIVLPPRMGYYAEVSSQIHAVFERYTPLVEPLSLDEAFLDVTGSQGLFGSAAQIGRGIQQAIREEVRLVASVGVAPNKFLAKIASDLEKPAGFVEVDSGKTQEFLDPLPVSRLWGVGRVSGGVLDGLGIRTIRQLRRMPVELLNKHFGKSGEHIWQLAQGIDDRAVVPDREAKSISHETTFSQDIADESSLLACLLELTEQVGRRLRRHKLRGRTAHIKVRFADFRTITRAHTFPEPTCTTQELWNAVGELLRKALSAERFAVRLLGVGMTGLELPGLSQRQLFEDEARQKQSRLDAVTDLVQQRFGSDSLGRAGRLDGKRKSDRLGPPDTS